MLVGFVGAGAMGTPMIVRLVAAGHEVVAYGRSDASRERAGAAGARLVATPAAVAGGAAVVVLCPFTDEEVRSVALDGGVLAAMGPGAVLVVHTTGSPATARALQDAAPEGVAVVDAPVSGGRGEIEDGRITLYLGGEPAAVERAAAVLAAYGDPIVRVGALGAGQVVKLLNNALFAAHLQLAAEAGRVASELAVDPALAARAVGAGSGASRALAILGGDPERLGMLAGFLDKDVDLLRAVADDLGVDLGLLDATVRRGPHPFGTG